MAKAFDSACASPLGAAIESPLGAKDCPGGFLYAALLDIRPIGGGLSVRRARLLRISLDGSSILDTYLFEEYQQDPATFRITVPLLSISYDGQKLWGLLTLDNRPPSLTEGSTTTVSHALLEFSSVPFGVIRRVPISNINTDIDRFGQYGTASIATVDDQITTFWPSFNRTNVFSAYWQLYDKASLSPVGTRIANTTLPAINTRTYNIDGRGNSLWVMSFNSPNTYRLYRLLPETFGILQTHIPPAQSFILGVTGEFVYAAMLPNIVHKLAADTLEQKEVITLNLTAQGWTSQLIDIAGGD